MAKTVLGDRKPVFKVEEKKNNTSSTAKAVPLPLEGKAEGEPKATGIGAREKFEIESRAEKRRQELIAAHKTELDKKKREERKIFDIQNRRRGFNYVPTATQKAEKRRNELIGAGAEYRKNDVKPGERKGFVYTPSASTFGGVTYNRNFEVSKMADDFINTNSPFGEYRITSKTGSRDTGINGASKNHAGLDRAVPEGTAVSLPMDTTFRAAGYDNARGYWIEVTDKSGNILHYQHLRDYGTFKPGQMISAGTPIARSGSTGVGTAHLHEEYYTPDGRNITESYWAKYANQTPESIENWKKTKKQISEVAVVGGEKENTVISKADNATKYLMEKATAGFERVGYEYISFLDKLGKKLERADNSWIIKGDDFTKGIRGIISSGARKGIIKFLDSEGFENLLEKSKRDYQEYTNDAQMTLEGFESEAAKTVLSGAGMVAEQAARLVPTAIIGTLTGGAGLAPKMIAGKGIVSKAGAFLGNILSKPMFWNSYIQQSGAAYADAKEYGATEEEAQAASDVIGFVNAMIENIGGIESVFGEKVAPSVIGRFIKELTKTAVEEGVEEGSQDIVENLVNKLVYKEDAPIFSITNEDAVINPLRTGKEVLAGAVMGGIFYGTNAAFSSALSYATDGENLSDNIKNMSPEELQAVKQAVSNIQKKAESGAFDGISKAELDADSDVQVIRDAVKFSIAPDFETNYDKWVNEGRPDRKSITVGRTSEALKSIGVKEQRIIWDTTKINKALKKHSYLNDGILKQIPQLIDEPVIVMQSKSIDSRITMLGEVYDGDGLPVMAVLELLPLKDKSGVVLDEIKVVSTHSRKTSNPSNISQTQNVISTSRILYVEPNRKRTDSWLMRTGLQLPVSITNYGSINNISYPDENVNDFVSLMGSGAKNTQEGRVLGETQRKFFEAFGLQVEMDEQMDVNAKILLDEGKVIVSPYAVINDWEIVRHEFTHQLKIKVPEAYELYTRLAREEMGDRWNEYYEEAEKDYTEYYARKNKNAEVTPELIEEEVYARYAEGLDNNAFIEKVANENATFGAKIRNLLKNIIERIKGMFSRGELRGNTDSIKKIISAKDAWENAVIESAKKKGKGFKNNSASVRYSESSDTSIKDQLIENAEILDKMDAIAKVNSNTLFTNSKSALEWAVVALKNSGYKAERRGFGTIIFDEKRLKNGLRYMKDNTDYLAYALIPKIVKQGIVIDKHANHKNRGYDTYTFAGPVEINGKIGNMAVVVRSEGKNYYKLHKVVFPDGGMISYNKESSAERAAATNNVVDMPTDTTSISSISQERQSVNKEFMESSEDRVRQLESENEKLKEANDFLKEFFVQTGQVHIDALHISDIAEGIKRRYESHMPARDIGAKLQAIYTKMSEEGAKAESDIDKAEIAKTGANELFALAQEILEQSDAIDRTMYNRYAELRHDLRTVGLSISARDARDIPDFNDFRKRNMNRVKITSKGISVDSYYEELIELYPEFFASEEISAPSDRLLRIVEVRDMLDPKYRDVAYSDEEASALAIELYTEYFSDKNAAFEQQSLAKMIKDKYAKSLREQYNEKLKKAVDFYREQMEFYRNLNQNVEDRIAAVPMGEENIKGYTDTDFTGEFKWYKSKLKDTGVKFIQRRSPGGKKNTILMTFERSTREALRENSEYRAIIERVKSRINGDWEKGKSAKTQFEYSRSNIWRSFRRFFGDQDYRKMKELILDPLEDSKRQFMHIQEFYSELIYNKVEKELGIKKGSKMSALVQKYGEKVLTEEELEKISEKDMEKIKLADRIFRMCYDGLIDTINDTRRAIYPDADTKAKDLEDEIIRIEKEIGLIELGFMTGDFADVKGFDNYTLERIAIRQESAKELAYRIKLNAEQRAASLDAKIEKIEADMASTKNKTTKRYQDMADRLARYEAEKAKWTALCETKQAELAEKIAELNSEFKANTEYFKQKLDKRLKTLNERLGEKQAMLQADEITYGKTIEKRKDYYRHFADLASEVPVFFGYIQQMTQDNGKTVIEAAKEYFDRRSQKSNIDNRLAGKSADTKPRAKWQSFAQHRADNSTAMKYDAVGGFLEYLPAAAYSAAIDPQISIFRTIAEDLAAKVDGKDNNTNLGSFIGYLTEYANDLAGKTHAIDRVIVDSLMSRDAWNKLNWVSGRIKGNMISFNFSSMFAQILNMPNAIATIKNPVYFIGAMGDVVAGIKDGTDVSERYKESQFLNERYTNYYSKFEHGVSATARKVSEWMLQALDEVNGRVIWNAAYRKAVKLGEKSPVRYADDVTRRLVAGRQIGEMQLYQKSRIMGMLMPFSVEVANNWDVIEDIARDSAESGRKHSGVMKAAVTGGQALWGVLLLLAANWLFDELLERLRGSDGGLLNPIKVIEEGIKNGESVEEMLGGIAGDAIGATSIGSAVASLYPEQGMQFGDKTTPTRAELFGSNDPTRYGTGNMFSSALKKPFNYLVMPGGGSQLDKTMTGYKALKEGAITNKKGEVQYEVDNTNPVNVAKGLLFGKSGFKETSDYYDAKDSKGIYEKYLSRKAGMRKTMQQTELERLIGIDEGIKPTKPGMTFEFNDVEYKPGRYYETYEKMYGMRASQYYNKVMLTDEYKAANDDLKIVMVKDAFKNALKDAKAAYVLWAKNGFPKDGGSFEQSFESEFVGKKIVGNGDAAESYTAEGFPKGKGYVEVESGGQVHILQGDAYNAYEKARYDEFARMSELMNKSGTMTVRNETGAKNNVTKMKAILKQLVSDGVLADSEAEQMYYKYKSGAEIKVPVGVEFIVGRQEEYQVGYEELTKKDKSNISKNLKAKIKNKEITAEEAGRYIADIKSGKMKYTKKRYITGDFNSLTKEQQEKVLESINKGAKEKAIDAVEGRLN